MAETLPLHDDQEGPGLGAHELFEILVRDHEPKLRGFVAALVRDPGAIDDLVQEAFLVAWRNLGRYDRNLPFGPWLRGIARRLCLAHYRKTRAGRIAFVGDDVAGQLDGLYGLVDRSPGDTVEEQLASLRACLRRLPEHQRRVLALHYEEEMGCKEIAAAVGRSREAVKKLLQRARAWLGRCIEQRLEALGGEA